MSRRSNVAAILRLLNVTPFLDQIDHIVHALEGKVFRLANRLDPPMLPYDVDQWPTIGYVSDEGIDTDPWEQALEEQHKIVVPPLPRVEFKQFVDADLSPFIEQIDAHIRELAQRAMDAREAPMVEWLEEVADAVGDFGPDTAREIVRGRDRFMPEPIETVTIPITPSTPREYSWRKGLGPLADGEIGRAGE